MVDAVLGLKKLQVGESGEGEVTMRFGAPRRRPKEDISIFELELHVMCNCYIGCDLRDKKANTPGQKVKVAVHDGTLPMPPEVKYLDSDDESEIEDPPTDDDDEDDDSDSDMDEQKSDSLKQISGGSDMKDDDDDSEGKCKGSNKKPRGKIEDDEDFDMMSDASDD